MNANNITSHQSVGYSGSCGEADTCVKGAFGQSAFEKRGAHASNDVGDGRSLGLKGRKERIVVLEGDVVGGVVMQVEVYDLLWRNVRLSRERRF